LIFSLTHPKYFDELVSEFLSVDVAMIQNSLLAQVLMLKVRGRKAMIINCCKLLCAWHNHLLPFRVLHPTNQPAIHVAQWQATASVMAMNRNLLHHCDSIWNLFNWANERENNN